MSGLFDNNLYDEQLDESGGGGDIGSKHLLIGFDCNANHLEIMKNPPKTDPTKPGIFARRKANRFFGMDNLTVNYLLTKSIETHKSPEEIIGEMVRERIAASA